MKLNGVSVLAVLALAGAAMATPRESTTFPASVDSASNGAVGAGHLPADGVVTLNQTFVGGYTTVRVNATGALENTSGLNTYSNEARIYVVPPAPNAPFTIQPFIGNGFAGVLPIPAGYGVALPGYDPVGNWTYTFYETYQDGAGGQTNSTWQGLVLTFDDAAPPPPPPPTADYDAGVLNLAPASTILTQTIVYGAGEVKWVKFIVPAGGVTLAGGKFLDLDTEGNTLTGGTYPSDTYITLFNQDGTIRVQDDDSGNGFASQFSFGIGTRPPVGTGAAYDGRNGDLPAGTYFLALYAWPNGAGSPAAPFVVSTTSASAGDMVVNLTFGSQAPPAPPATFTNLGVIPNTGVFVTATGSIDAAGQVNWYKFALSAVVDRANREYLDIDTEESTASATAIGLFNADTGAVIITDTVDGTGNLSQITIGRGVRPAVSDGVTYNGRDGATMAAGDYFIAVTEPTAAFNAGWRAVSNGAETGVNIKIRVRRGVQPPATPPAGAIDIGNLRGDKVIDTEDGQPITITDTQIKWYKFTLSTDANDATTRYVDIDTYGSDFDTELGLYDAAGTLKAANDDGGAGLISLLTFGDTVNVRPETAGGTDDFPRDGRNGPLVAGAHYLAVGKFNTNYADEFDVVSTAAGIGTLIVNIYNNYPIAVPRCNAADVAGLGGTVGPDLQLTADDVIVYLGAFFTGNLAIADIAVLGGAPGQDGQLTADDIILFLSAFFSPCNP
ncbi:MAG: GC-type dockerin domain-anchored protein [Phycisphaerales bacterium]